MKVVFLGYGVGQFELEFLPGCPQLSSSHPSTVMSFRPEGAAPRFDLSAPAPAPGQAQHALKSSWASDKAAQAALHHRKDDGVKFSNTLQFGKEQVNPLAGLEFDAPTRRSSSDSAASSDQEELDIPTGMPANNRIVIASSVVLYQNCMVGRRRMWEGHAQSTRDRRRESALHR